MCGGGGGGGRRGEGRGHYSLQGRKPIQSCFDFGYLDGVLYGPLHNETAVKNYEQAISDVKAQGGTIVYGGKVE